MNTTPAKPFSLTTPFLAGRNWRRVDAAGVAFVQPQNGARVCASTVGPGDIDLHGFVEVLMRAWPVRHRR